MRKPIIGVTLDYETDDRYATVPWYALRDNYCTTISDAGGIPIALPHEVQHIQDYADRIDGLLITGGGFDIDPSLYGSSDVHATTVIKHTRTQFELGMLRTCLAQHKPIFGICGGMQLMNVALGGSLIQDIPSLCPSEISHTQKPPFHKPIHDIRILKGTHCHTLTALTQTPDDRVISINSYHHQAVDSVGEGLRVCAIAPDGIIEAIERVHGSFYMGVQWHPEYYVQDYDKALLQAFVDACRTR